MVEEQLLHGTRIDWVEIHFASGHRDHRSPLLLYTDDIEREIFTSVTLDDFCQAGGHINSRFDKQPNGLQQHMDGTGQSKEEIMKFYFEEHSPSKPLFGKMMVSKIPQEQIPHGIVEVIEITRELALRK